MTTTAVRLSALRVGGITLVRARGVLDLATYACFRDSLLKYAADEPTALIVELDWDLEIASTPAVSLFTTVWMRVSEWPGVPVLIVATHRCHRDLLAFSGVGRFVPYFSTLQAALDAVGRPPRRRLDRMSLPATAASVRQGHDFVHDTCVRWGLAPIADDATTVADELVDNVVRHTVFGPEIRLELRRDRLTIAVRDADPLLPVVHELTPETSGLRGLDVVEALSRTWGISPGWSGGKTVWAVLEVLGGARPDFTRADDG